MKSSKLIFLVCQVLLLFKIKILVGFYIHSIQAENNKNVVSSVISNFIINTKEKSKDNNKFPQEFSVDFRQFNENFKAIFTKSSTHSRENISPNIYVIGENGNPVKYKLQSTEDYEHYAQQDGEGFATLIKNKEKNTNQKYRMIGRITLKSNTKYDFDIIPILNSRRKKRGVKRFEKVYEHALFKRKVDDESNKLGYLNREIKDFILIEDKMKSKQSENFKYKPKAYNGNPVVFDVETLLVADVSIFNSHKIYADSSSQDKVFLHMSVYYSHIMNGVNQRYQNSLSSDADLRINIKLTNFLFITTQSDSVWTDTSLVGDSSYTTYDGKEVVLANASLNSFKTYMESKTFNFSYDHALAVFNKDMWEDDTSGSNPATRSGIVGLTWVGQICGQQRYSINEDYGGFSNIAVIAHEMGHNLGSQHDGVAGVSDSCPTTDYYIMTPTISYTQISNIQRFSTCSISQFKSTLLTNNENYSASVSCLVNINNNLPTVVQNANQLITGQYWSASDQCKQRSGVNALFCQSTSADMCSQLYCRTSLNETSCTSIGPAVEGTTCGVGKICVSGTCTTSSIGQSLSCPFGDEFETNGTYGLSLPNSQSSIQCSSFLTYLESISKSVSFYCRSTVGQTNCCQTCLRYNYLTCYDSNLNCPSYSRFCASNTANINGILIKNLCARTCGTCTAEPLKCGNSTFACQNGGTCVDITVSSTSYFGFTCSCPSGYTGDLCETKTTCNPNPCKNNGVCVALGSNGFYCECSSPYYGIDCSSGGTATTTAVITNTITTTSPKTTTVSNRTPSKKINWKFFFTINLLLIIYSIC